MHILVTGANSFVGRHATAALRGAGLNVTASFRSEGQIKNLPHDINFVRLDLGRESDFSALPKTIDAIVHLAGVSTVAGVTVDDMLACNVTGARNLLKYAHRADARRLIFASTLSVHGRVDEPVVTETTPVRSPDIYGASKHLAERLFAEASDWLPCVALRLPGVLGAGAHRAWIPTLLDRVRRHEPVTAYSLGSMFNNAVHVHDLNDLMLKLLAGRWSGFHAFPLGAAGTISIADLVELMITLTGSRSTVAPGSTQKTPFLVSSDYAVRTFDYRPMDIEAMLRRYVSESAPEA